MKTASAELPKDDSSDARERRALNPFELGAAAVRYLLRGTREIRIDGSGYRLFEKQGVYKTALKDFNAVQPEKVRLPSIGSSKFKATGTVGDRRIQLIHNDKDIGNRRHPQLLISNPTPGERPYKIIYKKTID